MRREKGCEARQFSDSVYCKRCDLGWDYGDPDPPECGIARRAREVIALSERKQRGTLLLQTLKESVMFRAKPEHKFNQLPKGCFPEIGIREGLYRLQDERLVSCAKTPPHGVIPPRFLGEENHSQRFYTVYGFDGRPVWFIYVTAHKDSSWAYHTDRASSLWWKAGIPVELQR